MTQILVLERYCYSGGMGTFGRIRGAPFEAFTVEQPWRGNRPFVSCVPEAVYELVPYSSEKYPHTFALVNPDARVFARMEDRERDDDRYACVIHSANWARQLQGCVAAGDGEGADRSGEWMVTNSAATVRRLLAYIREREIRYLHVTSYRPQWP